LADEMQRLMPPRIEETEWIPRRNNTKRGLVAGQPAIRRKEVAFNPSSPDHIRQWIYEKHGLTPSVQTDGGLPSTKAEVLAQFDLPETNALLAWKVAAKLRGMICGPNGWLSKLRNGRMHTSYRTLGTLTGRCAHSPNVAQVPSVRLDANKQVLYGAAGHWGFECRHCFIPPPEWPDGRLVGIDQQGLEIRMLAHYLAPWNPSYAEIACDNPHDVNASLLNTPKANAKRFLYACVYGAGYYRLGSILSPEFDDEWTVRWIGQQQKAALINGISGFRELFWWLDSQNGRYLEGLDCRPLYVRKQHAKLNTLLQSAGAIVCKRWTILMHQRLYELGLHHGNDFRILANIHDENQVAARNQEIAEMVAQVGVDTAREAGEFYSLKCPTAGEAKIGDSWALTH
jgi:DNA polymerase I-like protein with 3'-5' exonuclease and polymerase domains